MAGTSNIEIERKFLVKGNFRNEVFRSDRIVQGYLNSDPHRTVRVRVRNGKGILTIKSEAQGTSRFEWEKEIPVADAQALLALSEPGSIDKIRHLVKNTDGRHVWEIDEFKGDNEGLIVAEIELADTEENFDKPQWLGEEVTGDNRYYNSMLSVNPYKNWK